MQPNTPPPSGDRLALLYQLTQAFNSSLDLDEVLNRVMAEVISALHAERGFVMLKGPDDRLEFRVARGLEQNIIDDPQFQVSRSIVEQVAHSGQAVITSDAQADERFNIRHSVMFLGLRSILCVPLKMKDRVIGVIYADNRLQVGLFTFADLDLLNAIASSAAIAIENARLYQVAVEKGRLEQELQMARRVQMSLLPRETPPVDGWEFITFWKPARQVGGDYYDFIPNVDGRLGVVIADVTDKSMGAALFMAFTRSIVRANVDHAASPAAGISRANELICKESDEGLYVTLCYALIDTTSGQVTYVNAGHNPPLYVHCEPPGTACQLTRLSSTGMPLGVDEEMVYSQQTIQLDRGDFIVFYTDGVTEAINARQELYGQERLETLIRSQCDKSAREITANLENSLAVFTGSTPPSDDITIVVARRI